MSNRRRPGVRQHGPSRFISEIEATAAVDLATVAHHQETPAGEGAARASYARGNLVSHPRYGRGLVVKARREGDEWMLTVDFGFDEPKILLTGYVPIEVLKKKGSRSDII